MTPIRNITDRERKMQAEIDSLKEKAEYWKAYAESGNESFAAMMADRESLKADALRYRGLRQMCVQLSLSNDTTAMLLKDQSELDAAMKEGAA